MFPRCQLLLIVRSLPLIYIIQLDGFVEYVFRLFGSVTNTFQVNRMQYQRKGSFHINDFPHRFFFCLFFSKMNGAEKKQSTPT